MRALRKICCGLLACAALASCGRDVADAIHDNSQELSGLRKAVQQLGERGAGGAPPRERIDEALAPLRDVLTQLGSAQRELADRQQSLAQEMRRWTQLIVQQQSAAPDQDAQQLADRLQQLEAQMKAQDARHLEVEALLQGALDHTADRLQDFLQRLEKAPAPPAPGEATGGEPNSGAPNSSEASATTGGGGEPDEQKASAWWWALVALALGSGGWLLLDARRRRQPVGLAPEMRGAPIDADAALGEPPLEAPPFDAATDGLAPFAPPPHEPDALFEAAPRGTATSGQTEDEPEVEELWEAAALLGEAIGKLRQNGVDPRATLPIPADTDDDVDLDDLFVLDEDEPIEPSPERRAPVHQPSRPEPLREALREALRPTSARPTTTRPSTARATPAAGAPAAVQCSLPARDPERAESAVRRLLDNDPRVLLTPPPAVEPRGAELRVSFSVLPGLPAGERSLIEQRLRDGVA